MTKDEALRLALEALKKDRAWLETDAPTEVWEKNNEAIKEVEAALEAKDEKANDELRRLHDLLGKANALARIRANKIDELEQRLTKTEAQLGEAVWNYGELKREQLANQQKTSGSPINTSTALEAKDEPWEQFCDSHCVWTDHHPDCKLAKQEPVAWLHRFIEGGISIGLKPLDLERHPERWEPLYTTPPQSTWVGLTEEEKHSAAWSNGEFGDGVLWAEKLLKERNT